MEIRPLSNINDSYRRISLVNRRGKAVSENNPQVLMTKAAPGISMAALTPFCGIPNVRVKKPGINISTNIQKVINSYKERYNEIFADIEPVVAIMKNGKTRIEFLRNNTERHMLICNKNGDFDKRVVFNNYSPGHRGFSVYNSFDNKPDNLIKTFTADHSRTSVEGTDVTLREIDIKKYNSGKESYRNHIEVRKSDNYLYVTNEINGAFKKSTTASLSNGKPEFVYMRQVLPGDHKATAQYTFEPGGTIGITNQNPFLGDDELIKVMTANFD